MTRKIHKSRSRSALTRAIRSAPFAGTSSLILCARLGQRPPVGEEFAIVRELRRRGIDPKVM